VCIFIAIRSIILSQSVLFLICFVVAIVWHSFFHFYLFRASPCATIVMFHGCNVVCVASFCCNGSLVAIDITFIA